VPVADFPNRLYKSPSLSQLQSLHLSAHQLSVVIMNSLVATPPVPPHFYEYSRLSSPRPSKNSLFTCLLR
jgi:hypothetical protein